MALCEGIRRGSCNASATEPLVYPVHRHLLHNKWSRDDRRPPPLERDGATSSHIYSVRIAGSCLTVALSVWHSCYHRDDTEAIFASFAVDRFDRERLAAGLVFKVRKWRVEKLFLSRKGREE